VLERLAAAGVDEFHALTESALQQIERAMMAEGIVAASPEERVSGPRAAPRAARASEPAFDRVIRPR
jgi:hypothetical protein